MLYLITVPHEEVKALSAAHKRPVGNSLHSRRPGWHHLLR
jgi:hypothetical protein